MWTLANPTSFAIWMARFVCLLGHGVARRRIPDIFPTWRRIEIARNQIAALLARLPAGTLRRYPGRRRPVATRRAATGRRAPRPQPGWLVRLVPEVQEAAGNLHSLLHAPDSQPVLAAAPQLRRLLGPVCRMLGVRLPPAPTLPAPTPPASPAPSAPAEPPQAGRPDPASRRAEPPPSPTASPPAALRRDRQSRPLPNHVDYVTIS